MFLAPLRSSGLIPHSPDEAAILSALAAILDIEISSYVGGSNGAAMADPTGEADRGALRLDFDRRLKLEFHGSAITSDAGLLAYRELDDALGLTDMAPLRWRSARPARTGGTCWPVLLRQSVFGRLAGYEDVNDADRLCRDPAMRWVVGDRAMTGKPPRPARWAVSRRSG